MLAQARATFEDRGIRVIESVLIDGVATFTGGAQILGDLSAVNFIFGSNGSGKTTISRVIEDEASYPTCSVKWLNGTKLEAKVYSRDFVEKNYNQCAELKGIFTLGEEDIETAELIRTTKHVVDGLGIKIVDLRVALQGADGSGGKRGELASLEDTFKTKCWSLKQKHDPLLAGAFEGFRNSAEKFKAKLLAEASSNTATLESLADLEMRAQTVFGPVPTVEPRIPRHEAVGVLAHESNPILKKRVVGRDDVDIAAMVRKLGNSDWVKEGRSFFESNDGVCPFCRQKTTEEFAASLGEYFDESFEKDSDAIDRLVSEYGHDSQTLQRQLDVIVNNPSRFLDVDAFETEVELLESKVSLNLQRLADKKREPSQSITLEPLLDVVSTLNSLIDSANTLIADHNKVANNLAQERADLTAQVWRHLLDQELKTDVGAYLARHAGLTKAIDSITKQVEATEKSKATRVAELRSLEKRSTSIQPTVDDINAILLSFGFRGFSLAVADKCYKLVRPNGADAKDTLSEGEKTFVTFLYFYHLLRGNNSEAGMTTDRVVVIDDPVSSLDSDILFIVSSLIKGLFDDVRTRRGNVKQVLILTHNVYFHKEVSYNPKRQAVPLKDETFWLVRKPGLASNLKQCASNPIKTSYDLLWGEVRDPDRSSLTIQNTLRRILENYFKILGGVNSDGICGMFEGRERLICNSLFSWVNDGSHSAYDDLYVSIDDSAVESYLGVFRRIFERSDHGGHYRMMMGDAFEDDEPETASAAVSGESAELVNAVPA